ncbi:MAG: lysylphosphatidylglycerol synthase transmembrane domain-containing protein [Candidatus Methanoperedens sp.]|nr:lysylphosphatidylglycerol synthase transmembrane domain-containing protein [Candidatus Methanoperedens sp.]
MERFKKKNLWIVLLIGALILTLFAIEVGVDKFIARISSINKPLFLLVILFNFLNILTFTITWRYLIPQKIGIYKLFSFFMAGTFINNITPTFGTGGEPVKAMLLGKETNTNKAECFAGVVSQRMLNMFPFLVIGGLGVGLLFSRSEVRLETWQIIGLAFSITLAFSLFALIVYFYMKKDKLSSFVQTVLRFLAPFIGLVKKGFDHMSYAEAVEKSIDSFHGGLRNIGRNKDAVLKATLLSFLGWIFDILAIYSVFLSMGEPDIHISILIITYTLSMMSSWLPLFLPGGLGIVDVTMAGLFMFGGVSAETAMVAAWLYRLVNYWLNTGLGGYYLWASLKPK